MYVCMFVCVRVCVCVRHLMRAQSNNDFPNQPFPLCFFNALGVCNLKYYSINYNNMNGTIISSDRHRLTHPT